ncbi:MAG: hypothetical protein J1E05_03725 [Eubacterium sp.]|nr:hypothetical protein [Eubacterium sp.]
MSENATKKIYVLLTSFPDAGSKMVGFMTRSIFTHASIGLEEDMNTYYSFVWKGFIVEKITKYLRPDRKPYPCELYELEVTPQEYEVVKMILFDFVEKKHTYSFARVELIFGLMRMPIIRRNKYYCSQFIADVLKKSKILKSKRNSARFFPKDFGKLPGMTMIFKGDILGYVQKFHLLTSAV